MRRIMAVGGLAFLFALASLSVPLNESSFAQEKAKAPTAKDVKDVRLQECLVCVELSKISEQLRKLDRELDGIEKRAIANEKALQELRDIVVRNANLNVLLHAEQTKRVDQIKQTQVKDSKSIEIMYNRVQSICWGAIRLAYWCNGNQECMQKYGDSIQAVAEWVGLTNEKCFDDYALLVKQGKEALGKKQQ